MSEYSVGNRVIRPSMRQDEKNRIIKELRKEGLDIDRRTGKVVPKGYYYTNKGRLMKQHSGYDAEVVNVRGEYVKDSKGDEVFVSSSAGRSSGQEIITRRNVPDSVVDRRLERYNKLREDHSTPRDTVFDSRGNASSKAFELQSGSERRNTTQISTNFISTKDNLNYRGKDDDRSVSNRVSAGLSGRAGSVYLGSNSSNKIYPSQIEKPQGSIKAAELNFLGKLSRQANIYETQSKRDYNKPSGGLAIVGAFGAGVVKGGAGFVSDLSPVNFDTGKWKIPLAEGAKFGYSLATRPTQTVELISADASQKPISFLGELTGTATTPKVFGKSGPLIKNVYVKAGSRYVPSEKVIDVGVLEGKTTFPMSKSVDYSLKEFSKSDVVVTASPQKIGGTTVGVGKKASLGLEDPGIYVTPKGRASAKFTGIESEGGYSLTLNPLTPLKNSFKIPTLTEFKVRGVIQQPRSVVSQPGFSASRSFFEGSAGRSGFAFITKRSELGVGNLKRQWMTSEANFKLPKSVSVIRGGVKIKTSQINKGDLIKEFGSSELESVIPTSAEFKYSPSTKLGRFKGFDEYTMYKGRAVAIRKARVLSDDVGFKLPKGSNSRLISGRQVASESSYLSAPKSYSPLSVVKYVPRFSSRYSTSSTYRGASLYSYGRSSFTSGLSSVSGGGSSFAVTSVSSSVKGFRSSVPKSSYGSSSVVPYSSSYGGSSSTGKPPLIPSFEFKGEGPSSFKFRSPSARKDSFKSSYSPSVAAAYFGVKSKKVNVGLAKTGLIARPLEV